MGRTGFCCRSTSIRSRVVPLLCRRLVYGVGVGGGGSGGGWSGLNVDGSAASRVGPDGDVDEVLVEQVAEGDALPRLPAQGQGQGRGGQADAEDPASGHGHPLLQLTQHDHLLAAGRWETSRSSDYFQTNDSNNS